MIKSILLSFMSSIMLSSLPDLLFPSNLPCASTSLFMSYSLLLSMLSFSTPVFVSFLLPSYLSLYPSFHLFQPSFLLSFFVSSLVSFLLCALAPFLLSALFFPLPFGFYWYHTQTLPADFKVNIKD
ncbi:hypothetical protein CHARACLAT_017816 [Characodon lateralis]|uniref:NADH dehydrogenase subunit 6 n=1 Tax=Characodon lateralis TaxID=208331 RepID=A0ABU7DI36_9TELE|nr:hypothetical protein [Characodon lateralis]